MAEIPKRKELRLVVLTTSFPRRPGDLSGHFVRDLALSLVRSDPGLRIRVFAPADAGTPPYDRLEGVEVVRLRYFWPSCYQRLAYGSGIPWNLRSSWAAWINVPFFLSAFGWAVVREGRQADLIHAHWGILGALAVFLRGFHRRSVVLTVHGSDLRSSVSVIRWMTEYAIRNADAVVTPSPEFESRCRQIRGNERLCDFVPNGVHLPFIEDLERRNRMKTGIPHLITVGRLIPERRHAMIVRAVDRLRKEGFPEIRLTVVGDGPLRGELQEMVDRLQLSRAVELTGGIPTEDVSAFLMKADLYISATTIDNFGTAVVEAAAHGLPIVATRVGFPAVLVEDGQTGFLVEPDDEEALYRAVREMVGDPEKRLSMGVRMRKRIEEMGLDWSSCAGRMSRIYRECLAQRSFR